MLYQKCPVDIALFRMLCVGYSFFSSVLCVARLWTAFCFQSGFYAASSLYVCRIHIDHAIIIFHFLFVNA